MALIRIYYLSYITNGKIWKELKSKYMITYSLK